jgi:hypothetical protein
LANVYRLRYPVIGAMTTTGNASGRRGREESKPVGGALRTGLTRIVSTPSSTHPQNWENWGVNIQCFGSSPAREPARTKRRLRMNHPKTLRSHPLTARMSTFRTSYGSLWAHAHHSTVMHMCIGTDSGRCVHDRFQISPSIYCVRSSSGGPSSMAIGPRFRYRVIWGISFYFIVPEALQVQLQRQPQYQGRLSQEALQKDGYPFDEVTE